MKFRYLTAILAVAACGGKAKPATTTTTGAETGSAAGSAAPAEKDVPVPEGMAFKDMNADQRVSFMKHTVLPTMKPIFQEFDAKAFADFTCKTCHGKGAEDGDFDMPNPDIAKLPKPENFMAYAKDPKHAPWVQFMATKVKPEMAKLLEMSEFDPKTNTGDFSCHNCHLAEGEEAKKK